MHFTEYKFYLYKKYGDGSGGRGWACAVGVTNSILGIEKKMSKVTTWAGTREDETEFAKRKQAEWKQKDYDKWLVTQRHK